MQYCTTTKNNILDTEPAISKDMSDKYWVSSSPLLIGDHLLYFAAEISMVNGLVLIDIHANTKERSVKIVRPIKESVGIIPCSKTNTGRCHCIDNCFYPSVKVFQ